MQASFTSARSELQPKQKNKITCVSSYYSFYLQQDEPQRHDIGRQRWVGQKRVKIKMLKMSKKNPSVRGGMLIAKNHMVRKYNFFHLNRYPENWFPEEHFERFFSGKC